LLSLPAERWRPACHPAVIGVGYADPGFSNGDSLAP
jgi:hypothetical protein